MDEKIVLLGSILVAGVVGVLAFSVPIDGGGDGLSVSVEEVSLDSSPTNSVTEPFVAVESRGEDRVVIVGRVVSYSGVVNGFESNVRTENSTVYVTASFDKPEKPPTAPRAQVVNFQEYRVTLENTSDYDSVLVNGEEFDF